MNLGNSFAVVMLAVFCTTPRATALDPGRRISQYAHTAWRTQDGTFHGTPSANTQTADGYIWIGTDAGLLRFDGVRFVPWEPPSGKQLPGSAIEFVLGSRDGTLWIGTNAGLASWKAGNLVNYSNAPGRIDFILEDHKGTIWVARTRALSPGGGFCQVAGAELRCLEKGNGARAIFPQALAEDRLGGIWIGSATELLRWKSGNWSSWFESELKSKQGLGGIFALAADKDENVWVGFGSPGLGLRRLHGGVRTTVMVTLARITTSGARPDQLVSSTSSSSAVLA